MASASSSAPIPVSIGVRLIQRAVEADNNHDLTLALALYTQGLDVLVRDSKNEKNQEYKTKLQEKLAQYMVRAGEIKKVLYPNSVSVSAPTPTTESKTEPKEQDPDKAQLKSAISSVVLTERPNVPWESVAGLEQAKSLLKEAATLPIKQPQLFNGARKPWKGILLYGPPGTGKSFLAKALATECGASCFMSVSSSDLVSKYQGESERLVKELFEMARERKPTILFIDEIDSLCSARSEGENESSRRIKTELLIQMDGVGNNNAGVLILGATNTPWELDIGFRRRFQKKVYIPLPDHESRVHLLKTSVAKTKHSLTNTDFNQLAESTDGFSGADISILVGDALYESIRTCQLATHFKRMKSDVWEPCSSGELNAREMKMADVPDGKLKEPPLTVKDFLRVTGNAKASVCSSDLVRYDEWTLKFGQSGQE